MRLLVIEHIHYTLYIVQIKQLELKPDWVYHILANAYRIKEHNLFYEIFGPLFTRRMGRVNVQIGKLWQGFKHRLITHIGVD